MQRNHPFEPIVFAAAEMGIAIKPTAQERIATTEKKKAKLLIMPNETSVPDPLTLKDGWMKDIYLSDVKSNLVL